MRNFLTLIGSLFVTSAIAVNSVVVADTSQWVPAFHALGNQLLFKQGSDKKYVSEEGPLVVSGDFFIPKQNDKFTAIVDLTQCYKGGGTIIIHDRRIKWTEDGEAVTDLIAQSLCGWAKLQPDEDD